MTKYQTKPRTVEAVQWTGDNLEEVKALRDKLRGDAMKDIREWVSGHAAELLRGEQPRGKYPRLLLGEWVPAPPETEGK